MSAGRQGWASDGTRWNHTFLKHLYGVKVFGWSFVVFSTKLIHLLIDRVPNSKSIMCLIIHWQQANRYK